MTVPGTPVRLVGAGLVLREWAERDLPVMVELFDDAEVARGTPRPSPFTLADSRARLDRGQRRDPLQLAITADGDDEPLGEVMLMATGHLGYVLGPRHRGKGLAARAVLLLRDHAHDAGHEVLRLQISTGNEASVALARRTGFRVVPGDEEVVVDKGRTHRLQTWEHRRSRPTAPGR